MKLHLILIILLVSWTGTVYASDCSRAIEQLVRSQKPATESLFFQEYKTGQALGDLEEFIGIFDRATNTSGDSYEYVVAVLKEVLGYEVFTVRSLDGRYIGFTSLYRGVGHYLLEGSPFQGRSLSYMATAMIEPEYQGRGLYGRLNQRRFEVALEQRPEIIFTRTQNPRVERGMRKALDEKMQAGLIDGWKLTRIKKDKAYGQMLTPERVVVSDPETQAAFDLLVAEAGDAYLLIFEILYP
jgi:hypothetical protein